MTTIEIARRMAQLGERESALKAYALVAHGDATPAELLEAAAYTLDNGGDYKLSYTIFVQLYNAGCFRSEILPLMTKTFYEPNIRLLKGRYERNCKLLAKYPYLFRKDFPAFEDLPVSFFPYDDHSGYVPFDLKTGEFRDFVNVKETVVSRNFFGDLEKPVLAEDVYSQYELEYLNDNVRLSENIGRENHIYLHYTDWEEFCAWLQVLTMKPLLADKKMVFLIGDELAQYPIDFKERFGVDYSKYPVKPISIREVNKLIWHTQLSAHNGGDFFNEIFDGHPNLLCMPSLMLRDVEKSVTNIRKARSGVRSMEELAARVPRVKDPQLLSDIYSIRDFSDKDALVTLFLGQKEYLATLDPASRIAPALFFQPHFDNVVYTLSVDEGSGATVLDAPEREAVSNSLIFKEFKYIKTFTPLRRFTTSYCGTLRFMLNQVDKQEEKTDSEETGADPEQKKIIPVVPDVISQRILNRSYLRDPDDRLYKDSIIVRFEDGKLNPKATFTKLAAFLDIPYDECMTYCSEKGERDPVGLNAPDAVGFALKSVFRTYDEYVNDNERKYIEFFLQDAYKLYGYDFQWYDGSDVDEAKVDEWVDGFTTLEGYIRTSWMKYADTLQFEGLPEEQEAALRASVAEEHVKAERENRKRNGHILLRGTRFINKRGQPLSPTPMLRPDPDLLEREIYH